MTIDERKSLMDAYRLFELQNHAANVHQDHLTVCGFFTEERQFADHAAYLRGRIYNTIPVIEV